MGQLYNFLTFLNEQSKGPSKGHPLYPQVLHNNTQKSVTQALIVPDSVALSD